VVRDIEGQILPHHSQTDESDIGVRFWHKTIEYLTAAPVKSQSEFPNETVRVSNDRTRLASKPSTGWWWSARSLRLSSPAAGSPASGRLESGGGVEGKNGAIRSTTGLRNFGSLR